MTVHTSVELQKLAELVKFAEDYRLTRIIWISVLAVVLYDWFLTFSDELFIVFQDLAMLSSIYIVRVWALWGCKRSVLVALCITYLSVLVSESTVISIALKEVAFEPLSILTITGCIPSNIKPNIWAFWIPMLFFETLLLVLCLAQSSRAISLQRKTPQLIFVIFRDAVVYFGSVVISIGINLAGAKIGGPELFATFLPLAIGSFSVMASRLLINVQAAVEPTYTQEYLNTSLRSAALNGSCYDPDVELGQTIPLRSMAFKKDSVSSGSADTAGPNR
ncbi:predicted protein [Postia placenta Mad-698-R]|nr:predicted protein [Postia placenta Mad-698-R]